MPNEFMVVERIVNVAERHDPDVRNPGFSGVDAESMMLRNYGEQGYTLVSVITEPVSGQESRRVFYMMRKA
jgi:hypothetical protein